MMFEDVNLPPEAEDRQKLEAVWGSMYVDKRLESLTVYHRIMTFVIIVVFMLGYLPIVIYRQGFSDSLYSFLAVLGDVWRHCFD